MNVMAPHPAFERLETTHIDSLNVDVHEYRHLKTGTPHFHIAADNPENAFLVGLRTVPEDSTGVAHILEHTVLCGSERYPVRDPFFMMIRRSLNTFMNAFTASDWTAYPFATQNRKDYFNLLDVYLDAVFFARLDELDFRQEGHRLEFHQPDNPKSGLEFKGVVFNEMKGAMSSPTSTLWQVLSKHLFPNNTYHHNSGGDPEAIPDLGYQQLVDFYRTHYHPSNAVFMTYGDIPAAELQAQFEERVLQRFEPLGHDVAVAATRRLHAPIRVEEAYALQEEDTAARTHIVLAWLLGESADLDERLRAHLLQSVLLDNSASPLLQVLEQSDLGTAPSPLCGLEDSAREMVIVAGLEGSEPEHADATEKLILECLERVARDGVPVEDIEAVLHQLELSQREIRGDGMPFGLQLLLGGLGPAMQRANTLAVMNLNPALERLRQEASAPDFIQGLVQRMLLDNPHRVRLTLRPDTSISARRNAAEKARLAAIESSLDEAQRQALVDGAAALEARQAQEDDPEVLPRVTLADVPAELPIPEGDARSIGSTPSTAYIRGTNGLVYPQVALQLPHLDPDLEATLPLFLSCWTELGSGGRDYLATQQHQSRICGGIDATLLHRALPANEQQVVAWVMLRSKALTRHSESVADLLAETLHQTRFDELRRIRELVAQIRASREQAITHIGHSLAMSAAASGMNPVVHRSHNQSGLAGIQHLKTLDATLEQDSELEALADRFERISDALQRVPRRFMWVADEPSESTMGSALKSRFAGFEPDPDFKAYQPSPVRERVTQLWSTNTEVNYCAMAFPTVPSAHEDAAALAVLGPFLRNGYLHRAIREQGGAYGGGASQDSDSASFRFFSYRDPRLDATLEDFRASIPWLLDTQHPERSLEESILNVISSIDSPGSPAGMARVAWQSELAGRGPEFRRAFRQRVLEVDMAALRGVVERYLLGVDPSIAVITPPEVSAEAAERLELERHSV